MTIDFGHIPRNPFVVPNIGKLPASERTLFIVSDFVWVRRVHDSRFDELALHQPELGRSGWLFRHVLHARVPSELHAALYEVRQRLHPERAPMECKPLEDDDVAGDVLLEVLDWSADHIPKLERKLEELEHEVSALRARVDY